MPFIPTDTLPDLLYSAGDEAPPARRLGTVLVGCEESQVVVKALRARGIKAYSCDLEPTRGNPEWHLQMDVRAAICSRRWELIILHPPCTALTVTGNKHYGIGKPKEAERWKSLQWTIDLWNLAKQHSERVALENPKGILFKRLGAQVQYIQPWQFGHGEVKRTGFALHRLPRLRPTKLVKGRKPRSWLMPPSDTRQRDRSETYFGVGEAMAAQWGALLTKRPVRRKRIENEAG